MTSQSAFTFLSFILILNTPINTTFFLDNTINSETQKKGLASFADHVLRQNPSGQIIQIIDTIQTSHPEPIDDATWYTLLQEHLKPYRSAFNLFRIQNLVKFQKALLKQQMLSLLGASPRIQSCVEIGTPGTYASTLKKYIGGKIYAVTSAESVTDLLQGHSYNPFKKFRAYDQHIPLADYEPISTKIPSNSIDLVICTIGLHHAPPAKLDAFVQSIHRALKQGGVFILREHDARSPELHALAYAAHSLFNVIIPQEPLTKELSEVRNFQPLSYWKQLLRSHGFTVETKEIQQAGDATLNTLIKCVK